MYVYRLPQNVTHTGDLHVELSYAPADCDCFVYLLGPVSKGSAEWQVCPGTYSQGFLSLVPGREVVDYAVPEVLDQTPTDESVVGDAYYAVVQAPSGLSRVRLTGYLPRTMAGSADTTSEATFTRFEFRTPASAGKTITVTGAPYSGAFDLTPTSQGRAECRLQYPADAGFAHRAGRDGGAVGKLRAVRVSISLGTRQTARSRSSQPTDYSHWDLYDQNRHAAAPLTGADWYGLQGGFTVQAGGPWRPRATYHYVPVLWLAAARRTRLRPPRPARRRRACAPSTTRRPCSSLRTSVWPPLRRRCARGRG